MTATEQVLEAVVSEVVETMFFSGVFGPAEETEGPRLVARVPFTGTHAGALEVAASDATAGALAANFLGVTPDEVPEGQAPAMLGEMANVLCGAVLGRIEPEGRFQIAPPELRIAADGSELLEGRQVFELAEGWLAVGWRID